MHPKEFYRQYRADDNLCLLNHALVSEVLKFNPNHVFEFGSGSGKNLKLIREKQTEIARSNIATFGVDISMSNVQNSFWRNDQQLIALGDESILRHLANFDVLITCSVLDHIEYINGIIGEFKRIANKAIVIAETNSLEGNYYYKHNYELYGFEGTGFKWHSPEDGATYRIWKWIKQ